MDQHVDKPKAGKSEQPPPDYRRKGRYRLDALNFFVADAQTGFGPYIASYLTGQGWSSGDVGNALSVGTLAALISQLPGGAMVDRLHDKRFGAAVAWIAMAVGAVLFALAPTKALVYLAEILHSFATSMLAPAMAAISLAIVGRKALGERLGRNARFAAIGNAGTAFLFGAIGYSLSEQWVFWLTAAFVVPGVLLLWKLPHPRHGPGLPDSTEGKAKRTDVGAFFRDLYGLASNKGVLAFALCVALFHLSNAPQLPFATVLLKQYAGRYTTFLISACVVGPQIIVATFSPWIGRNEERRGVRYILMAGYAAVPLRAGLLALAAMLGEGAPYAIVVIELLDGVSAAVFGVSLPIMAADLTKGSHRFNLCLGFFGIAITAGATLGNLVAGHSADVFGYPAAFAILAGFGLLAVGSVFVTVPDGAGKTKGHEIRHYLGHHGKRLMQRRRSHGRR